MTELSESPKHRILIVDDDDGLREVLMLGLRQRGYEVDEAASGMAALEHLKQRTYDVVITDLQMEGMDGVELSRRVAEGPNVPVIVVTGQGNLGNAVESMRAGVYDFLQKPVDPDVLSIAVERAVRHRELSREVRELREVVSGRSRGARSIVGESRPIRELQDLIVRVAPADISVLITGESGTGKELVARSLHEQSERGEGPFVAINCAAMPSALLESELFGHEKGAFTDARAAKPGLFIESSSGTLFLDEIGDMPLEMQAKLLRALQERRVRPVGGTKERDFDVRIIAATNRDLEEDIEEGAFREDLFYRINVVCLPVPPLRSRGRDVLLLAQHFIERSAQESGRAIKGLSEGAAEKLLAYDWPGNVRELENYIERAIALARYEEITVEDLPEKVVQQQGTTVDVAELEGRLLSMQELERRHIVHVLQAVDGNKTRAAKVLGFDRRTLYRKAERYGLDL